MQAHTSQSYKGKADGTSYPGNGLAVFLLFFFFLSARSDASH